MAEPIPDWLTLPEVADHYRCPEQTVRYWRHVGAGPKSVKLGTRVLYPRAEIERFDRELAELANAEGGVAEQSWPGLSGSGADHRASRPHRGSTRARADLGDDAAAAVG